MQFDASYPVSLGHILFCIRDRFHCTKPEDRIYGLLPLAEWPDGMPPIQPVYNTTSTLSLAELLLSIADEKSLLCWTILEALEIYHDYEPLRTLIEARMRIQDSHGASSFSGKYPPRASYKPKAKVLSLHKNHAGQLSASLCCYNIAPGSIADPVAEKAATLHMDGGTGKPQVLSAGSRIAGLLCGEAREGDVIMQHGLMDSILVLRSSNRDGLYKLIGQGILSDEFGFPGALPLSKGVLERRLEEVKGWDDSENKRELLHAEIEKACQSGQRDLACEVELRAEPIEWLIFEGLDFSKDRWPDKESRFKRLYIKLFMEATIV